MSRNNLSAQAQEVADWKDLQAQLKALQHRSFTIPVLDADPTVDDQCNLWMMYDGRIRFRNPATGVTKELTNMVTPGAAVSSPLTPIDPQTVSYAPEYPALWVATYEADGTAVTTSYGEFGNGRRCMIGFDATTMDTDLAGSQITNTELYLHIVSADNPLGTEVHVGTHTNVTAPSTWSGDVDYELSVTSYVVNNPGFGIISCKVPIAVRDSTITGVTIDPRNTNPTYHAVIAGIGTTGMPPILKVSYVK